jgi:hypothetical protein
MSLKPQMSVKDICRASSRIQSPDSARKAQHEIHVYDSGSFVKEQEPIQARFANMAQAQSGTGRTQQNFRGGSLSQNRQGGVAIIRPAQKQAGLLV